MRCATRIGALIGSSPTWLFRTWLFAVFTWKRSFASFCALCAFLWTCFCALFRSFVWICVFLRPTAFRLGNCRNKIANRRFEAIRLSRSNGYEIVFLLLQIDSRELVRGNCPSTRFVKNRVHFRNPEAIRVNQVIHWPSKHRMCPSIPEDTRLSQSRSTARPLQSHNKTNKMHGSELKHHFLEFSIIKIKL